MSVMLFFILFEVDLVVVVVSVECVVEWIMEVKFDIVCIIFGQEMVVEQLLVMILVGGYGFLVGVLGFVKIKFVEIFGMVFGFDVC